MSLYTLSTTAPLPSLPLPSGLNMEACTDISLLAAMASTTVEEVVNRFQNDHMAFVAYWNHQPAAFGWMARRRANIGELRHELLLPERNRYLWNFRTREAFRGLGIYPALLQFITSFEAQRADRFWIIHAPENLASLKGIKKAGFTYLGKLFLNEKGRVVIETNSLAKTYRELLDHMNLSLSEKTAASCWNCSSPYLKKRKTACCCAPAGQLCVGNNIFLKTS
ncbi:MAG: GNAT family N-acetyltransferase [Flavisolibacter sp.]